jgi:hypothetical protein
VRDEAVPSTHTGGTRRRHEWRRHPFLCGEHDQGIAQSRQGEGTGRMTGYCPHCGQRMLMRRGVLLSPRLADIIDTVARRGEAGVMPEVLASVIYGESSPGDASAPRGQHLASQ